MREKAKGTPRVEEKRGKGEETRGDSKCLEGNHTITTPCTWRGLSVKCSSNIGEE